ncbi:NtaA/DmoA family FMN-dependent monooxygenase [Pseudonocardia kongjuensis]|uniref:NtaA/DmoA family FMN-dependent monooxygenase n=1 Tax=Pseudonocardia kongjuensis TaxID=102227 RepID=A0ABP4IS94_9PSEU
MATPFHLAWFTSFTPPAWRSPWGGATDREWMSGDYYVSMVRQLERAGFDFIMFEDSTMVAEAMGGTMEADLKHSLHSPKLDPFPLLPLLARETEHIGLIATGSTSFYPPFILARVMATMDHLTGGRIGWNIVTSSEDIAAQNYGMERLPPHDERYDRAEEFVEIVTALWDSWEPGAVVADRETGRYADHTKVHPIHYVGKYHRSRGPLNMPAGPQGHPVLCQAGGSPKGRDFAAKHADAIVATNPRIDRMKEYRADIRERAARHGRDPDDIKVLFHLGPVLGETEQEARELHHRVFGMEDPLQIEQTLAMISAVTEIDFGALDLDAPMPQDLRTNGHQSILDDFMRRNKGRTLRESLPERAQLGPQVVGTVESVADQMEAIVAEVGGDGFLIRAETGLTHTRRYIDAICSGLAPELRRRGLIRDGYRHRLFRDNLRDF